MLAAPEAAPRQAAVQAPALEQPGEEQLRQAAKEGLARHHASHQQQGSAALDGSGAHQQPAASGGAGSPLPAAPEQLEAGSDGELAGYNPDEFDWDGFLAVECEDGQQSQQQAAPPDAAAEQRGQVGAAQVLSASADVHSRHSSKGRKRRSRSRPRPCSPAKRSRQRQEGPPQQVTKAMVEATSAGEAAAWEAAARFAAELKAGGLEAAGATATEDELVGFDSATYDWDTFLQTDSH